MKTKLITSLFIALPLLLASAADVKLDWDANAPAQQVTAYHVYERINNVNAPVGASPTNGFLIVAVAPGVHTYVVTATNQWGESPPSNPASTPGGATSPINIRVTISVTVP